MVLPLRQVQGPRVEYTASEHGKQRLSQGPPLYTGLSLSIVFLYI